ncbi:bifunctional indole-3-glycerol-phosphate synthase TrpC/phosphoribosylanthranilate isomerase TrpF [Aliidiomarina haloalkalitolerans]|nr:bifunctional indole-3-glycerol-phosphate synthase TrpC/phosphoribosylanthranilate isomerase TrpF [Aliidiomarina haloalkalitolerans]
MSDANLQFMPEDTPSILRTIVEQRQIRLSELQQQLPEAEAHRLATASTRPVRDFHAALAQGNTQFILECKKASPSKGVIRADFDPVAIARIYQSYAAAISVLTEPDFFHGDFSYLQAVSQQVHCPVLCKDFIFSTYQVALARYYGADAILLMLSVLDDATYQELATYAESLGLHILTEVSDSNEMQRANTLGAKIIGINHRNLRDMSMDLNRSQELAPQAHSNALIIAESGIENHQQVRAIAPHVDAFLVGGSLTAEADIDLACRELIYGTNKVCGITCIEHAFAARDAGASALGLIFAQRSPRRVTLAEAQTISQVRHVRYTAVISANDYDDSAAMNAAVVALCQQLPLHAVQVHDLALEQTDAIAELKRALPAHIRLHLAVRGDLATTMSTLNAMVMSPNSAVDRYLVDNGQGGSGQAFDWSTLTPEVAGKVILAGGLNLDNLCAALAHQCYALDLNSGFERAPGRKDPALLHQAFQLIRSY